MASVVATHSVRLLPRLFVCPVLQDCCAEVDPGVENKARICKWLMRHARAGLPWPLDFMGKLWGIPDKKKIHLTLRQVCGADSVQGRCFGSTPGKDSLQDVGWQL